jgi:hypothetical protein
MLEDRTQLYKRLRWEYKHGLGTIRGAPQNTKYIVGPFEQHCRTLATKAQSDAERTAENGSFPSARVRL